VTILAASLFDVSALRFHFGPDPLLIFTYTDSERSHTHTHGTHAERIHRKRGRMNMSLLFSCSLLKNEADFQEDEQYGT